MDVSQGNNRYKDAEGGRVETRKENILEKKTRSTITRK